MKDTGEKGFSAARAGKIERRVQPQRKIAPVTTYTVSVTGTLSIIQSLCPTTNPSTLKRRLESGERDLLRLRRPPEPNIGRNKTRKSR